MRSPSHSKVAGSPAGTPDAEVDWLERYRDGDAQAFRQLVDQYRDRMLQFFYRLCWDRDRAEDLAQDLFLKLMLGSKRYRPEGRMATFVYRVATNLWIDHYRQQRPRPRMFSYDQALLPDDDGVPMSAQDREPAPALEAENQEQRGTLRRALERLTEPHRLVFELAVYQERPYGEISELLQIPVGTVKSRMHNATLALKELLGAAGNAAGNGERGAANGHAASKADAKAHGPRRAGGGA
jgi:RNA polymerase sigma-70 factor (ECF subfamily)